jgi:hypothetical protein
VIPVPKPTHQDLVTYQDLLVLSFIGAFVAGTFVFVIAEPVSSLGGALDSAGIAFLVVFVLLALLMGIAISQRNSRPRPPEDETPEDPEPPSTRPGA